MLKNFFLLSFLSTTIICSAQIVAPYENYFNTLEDTIGWTHYAMSGEDNWEYGVPNGEFLLPPVGSLNSWVTNLDGQVSPDSDMALESPYYDLSDQSQDMVLRFNHRKHYSSITRKLEYRIGSTGNWTLLVNPLGDDFNWQSSSGFSNASNPNITVSSAISIDFLQGQDSVKFRFRVQNIDSSSEGWLIDNFLVRYEVINYYTLAHMPIEVEQVCDIFPVSYSVGFFNEYNNPYSCLSYVYLSDDDILDDTDVLVGSKSASLTTSSNNWIIDITLPENTIPGDHFLIIFHDPLNARIESNEDDNILATPLTVFPGILAPYIEDFEGEALDWESEMGPLADVNIWELGIGYSHHLNGTHSGSKAWHTSGSYQIQDPLQCQACNDQYLTSPTIDLSGVEGEKVVNWWSKISKGDNTDYVVGVSNYIDFPVEFSYDCGVTWVEFTNYAGWYNANDNWDFRSRFICTSCNSFKIRFKYQSNEDADEGIIIDDLYIGQYLTDLSIENVKEGRYTLSTQLTDTLRYELYNVGAAVDFTTTTKFYWSTDSIFDPTDILIFTELEDPMAAESSSSRYIVFDKPDNFLETYYIIYFLDAENQVSEMREYNNTGFYKYNQSSEASYPYFNDFESELTGWYHTSELGQDAIQWGEPNGDLLNSAFSGTKAIHTDSSEPLPTFSRMLLYTPIFNFTEVEYPILEFDMKLFSPHMNMEYSIDGGATWTILDTTSYSFARWYHLVNPGEINSSNFTDRYSISNRSGALHGRSSRAFATTDDYQGRDVDRNTHYVIDIHQLQGIPEVRFRLVFGTYYDEMPTVDYIEGFLIDNFQISNKNIDLTVNYTKHILGGSADKNIFFYMDVANIGNYLSEPTNIKYFLSENTELNDEDYYLGLAGIDRIQPDAKFHINKSFETPENYGSYNYLIFHIDSDNLNEEIDVSNNIGYWPLSLDSLNSNYYFNDFNNAIVDGWYYYCSRKNFPQDTVAERIRNKIVPAEKIGITNFQDGQWFTEHQDIYGSNYHNHLHLQTPTFDFSEADSIQITCDFWCTCPQTNENGNRMFYTLNGGDTWVGLHDPQFNYYIWLSYGFCELPENDCMWNTQSALTMYHVPQLDTMQFNLSYLKGKPQVALRFRYDAPTYPGYTNSVNGMRMDNFLLETFTADYRALDSLENLTIATNFPSVNIEYSIQNTGETNGRTSTLRFYWSVDSLFDSSDLLLDDLVLSPIPMGDTWTSNYQFDIPQPIQQPTYYILYLVDFDDDLVESNEGNNLGSFRITMPNYPNLHTQLDWNIIEVDADNESSFMAPYSYANNGFTGASNIVTNFYWSTDSLFDDNDILIHTESNLEIAQGDNYQDFATIVYPTPPTQAIYYLFYKTDGDNLISELDETDNLGVYKVIFYPLIGINENEKSTAFSMYNDNSKVFMNAPMAFDNKSFIIEIVDVSGKIINSSNFIFQPGRNVYDLPSNLAAGNYFFCLRGENKLHTIKIQITK